MADFSIISDISTAIIRQLRESLCPEPVQSPESVQLASPSDKNGDYQLGLFLYDIREASECKNSNPVRTINGIRSYPPKPLGLHYMLYLNSKAQMASGPEVEQRILGRAIQVLSDIVEMDVSAAQSYSQEFEDKAAIVLPNLNFEEKSRVWSALSQPYQISVFFQVSPIFLSSRHSEPFTRVSDAKFHTRPIHGKGGT